MRRSVPFLSAVLGLASMLWAAPALATPGPDSVVVVANANVAESVALAQRYARERSVPSGQVCLLDLPDVEDLSLADYESLLLEPLRACLDASGARDRIEAALLIRGVPIRVDVPVPDGDGTEIISLAAALGLWDSTLTDGTPLLGQPPGRRTMCGTSPCYAADHANPYRGFPFEPGWTVERSGVSWHPILVTMLHGRRFADAELLLDSALEAEAATPATGELLFMNGSDGARGALDTQYDAVIAELTTRGFTATRVPFDANLTGRSLSAFVTGTANLGDTIEGNTFSPGSLVDNLTSFGAVPQNFRATGESQVSIARWVAMGVAGAHGTTAEPLNNCFPNRRFLVEYVDGATLAEAFHAMMPFVYWQNLVLGDPMAAPYALRPTLSVTGVASGERLSGAVEITIDAVDPGMRGIASIVAYLDGVEIARADGDALTHCLSVPSGDGHQLLIVARAAPDPTDMRVWQPKGWVSLDLDSDGGPLACAPPMPDAGPGADAGISDASVPTDGGPGEDPGGCGCRVGAPSRSPFGGALLALAALVFVAARRRRGT